MKTPNHKQVDALARNLLRGELYAATRKIGALYAIEGIRAVSSPLVHPAARESFACHVARNSLYLYHNGQFSSANNGGE